MARTIRSWRTVGKLLASVTTATGIVAGTPLLAGASTALPPIAGRAPAAGGAEYILGTDGVPVTTANKQDWVMSVDYTSDSPANALSVGIVRVVSAGGTGAEVHTWGFAYSAKTAFTFSTTTGDGTLDTGSTYSPVVSVDLTFKSTSHKSVSCASGSETVYTGTLTGSAVLDTGLKKGGTVGGKSIEFNATGSSPSVTVDSGCVMSLDECLAFTEFSSGKTGIVGFGVSGSEDGAKLDQASVTKSTPLSAPKGAKRVDGAVLEHPGLTWNAKTDVLSVSTSAGGIVTGSATLSGGSPKTESFPCTFSGKKYTMTETGDTDPTYTSPSGKALTAHTSLTGNLATPATSTTGGYTVLTAS